MLTSIPSALDASRVRSVRERLDAPGAPWIDGRVSSARRGAPSRRNLQIHERSSLAGELGDVVLAALEKSSLFISAALPHHIYPPMFDRYEGGMEFGDEVEGAVRIHPVSGVKIRTDLSATLFLGPPSEYEGGELLVEDTYGLHSVKLEAGDLVIFPASSLHKIAPVTRGARVASFFWIQSLVRDDGQRTLLFELDTAIQKLGESQADTAARTQLSSCYHNLLRMWSDV